MPTNEEQLALEWRQIVLNKLASLEAGQLNLAKDIADIKSNFASVSEVNAIKSDIEGLKLYKAKATGIIIALNVVAAVIGWLVQTAISLHH